MSDPDLAPLESVLVGAADPEIVALEARIHADESLTRWVVLP